MSLVVDYGLSDSSAKLILMALSLPDKKNNKFMDKMYIHKIIKYFDFLRKKEIIDFSNYDYGKVSSELQEDLDILIEYDLINVEGNLFWLTAEGDDAAKELLNVISDDEMHQLSFAKKLLNDLTLDELMFFMYMKFPDSIEHSIEYDRLYKKRDKLTISLFKKQRITVDTASEWLKLSKAEFIRSVK